MSPEESDAKTCNRCGYVWNSYAEKPIRCPGCGTYHWHEVPTTNTCIMCGHKWFSRTTQVPIRCPKCKTRSWRNGTGPGMTELQAMDRIEKGRDVVDAVVKMLQRLE